MGGLNPDKSTLGAWIKSPLGVRTSKKPPPAPPGIGSRDFVELILDDSGGDLTGTLRLHGDVITNGAGETFNLVRALELFEESGRAGEGSVSINTLASQPPTYSFNPALTNTTCNGTVPIDTPLGVTDLGFTLPGRPLPSGGMSDIVRLRVVRGAGQDGEHWDQLGICNTVGSLTYFNAARKLLQGLTRLDSINTTGIAELLFCAGGSVWVGGGPNGGDPADSFVTWTNQGAGDVQSIDLAGAWSQWAIPGNAKDFTGTPAPALSTCWASTPSLASRLLGNDLLGPGNARIHWTAAGGGVPTWPNPGWEWICYNPDLPPGWPPME